MKRISQWRSVSNDCEQKRKSKKLKEERKAGRVDLVTAAQKLNTALL